MKRRLPGLLDALVTELPAVGTAGSRSALLHVDAPTAGRGDLRFDTATADQGVTRITVRQLRTFFILRWMGTVGSLLIGVGALGAGALPVVGNPYVDFPLGSLMSRMLQASSALVLVGVGLIVTAWVLMAPFAGTPLRGPRFEAATHRRSFFSRKKVDPAVAAARELEEALPDPRFVTVPQLWRTFASWIIPLIITAPLFTQDIYSYLAQGSIVAHGMDPYSAGPVQLLGTENELARSVPFIWANSPSPYGPVALGLAAAISMVTGDSIALGVFAHRILSVAGVVLAGWAITRLARRCNVSPEAALWLGILNPLTILHLIGGIHNESVLLGLALLGVELGLRGLEKLSAKTSSSVAGSAAESSAVSAWLLFAGSGALITCAGMVKVTGFIGLGFTGMALAKHLHNHKGWSPWKAVISAALIQVAVLAVTLGIVTLATGIGLGWVTGQGGAATIRSWLSMSTAVGVIFGFIGQVLGLGDHTNAMLSVTRTVGVLIAGAFMIRMLFATFRGSIHPVGGLGVATLALVILFPVVHPWYILWAVFPLAAWANRLIFRLAVVVYSTAMSFFVLPRGLGLPPNTVFIIYLTSAVSFLIVAGLWWVLLRRSGAHILN